MGMTDATDWQGRVGQTWAEEWQRTDRSFSQLTERLLKEQRGLSFHQVLDIGCGAGEISLAVARNHPQSQIIGLDISTDLIEAARARSEHLANVEFFQVDAATWRPDPSRRPDFLISRHGVMFFDEPVDAFANLYAAAAPDAKLAFTCFQSFDENVWAQDLMRALGDQTPGSDTYEPGPFAFGDRSRVEAILEQSGWRDVGFERFDYAMIFGMGDDAIKEAVEYFSKIGPAAKALVGLERDARASALVALEELARANYAKDLVAMPASAWIVTAIK